MQRRAIRDAKTPDKMKKSKSIKEDNNLSLQEKKDKIKSGLKKLTELGMANPKNRYQDLINDIAKVVFCGKLEKWEPGGTREWLRKQVFGERGNGLLCDTEGLRVLIPKESLVHHVQMMPRFFSGISDLRVKAWFSYIPLLV